MNPIIMIVSCERDRERGFNMTPRSTYLNRWGHLIRHQFLLGRPSAPWATDECAVDTGDHYEAVWQKSNAACKLLLGSSFTHMLLCDVDTYVVIPRLLEATRDPCIDYMGYRCDEGHAGQGHGIWLSRRACAALVQDPAGSNHFDWHAGQVLPKYGIHLTENPEFLGAMPKTWKDSGITAHLGRGTGNWNPTWMHNAHDLIMAEGIC